MLANAHRLTYSEIKFKDELSFDWYHAHKVNTLTFELHLQG